MSIARHSHWLTTILLCVAAAQVAGARDTADSEEVGASSTRPRVGLVLGGGGVHDVLPFTGHVYHVDVGLHRQDVPSMGYREIELYGVSSAG